MKEKLFKELKESIKQGGKILKGKRKPERKFDFGKPDPNKSPKGRSNKKGWLTIVNQPQILIILYWIHQN